MRYQEPRVLTLPFRTNRVMRVDVVNIDGTSTGRSVELSDGVFGVEPNDHVLYLAVKSYLAAQRQGTHKAKERGEIKGSTKKLKKQKGTGTARAGSIKSPVFKGGGRIFGPRPRKYEVKLNKKVKALARQSALAYKAKEEKIVVIEDFNMDSPKTKQVARLLKSIGAADSRSLLVINADDRNLLLSARNIKNAEVTNPQELNTYEILKAKTLLIKESALEALNNI